MGFWEEAFHVDSPLELTNPNLGEGSGMKLVTRLCLSASVILVAAVTAQADPVLSARVTASVYGTDGMGDYLNGPPINNYVTDYTPLTPDYHVVFPKEATSVSYPSSNSKVVVNATVGASAGMGDLSVYAFSEGLKEIGSGWWYYGSGGADAKASFTDTVMINASASHAAGTWVWINASLEVDETRAFGPGAQMNLNATLSVQGSSSYDSRDESGNPFGLNNTLFYNYSYDNMVLGSAKQNLYLTGEFRVGQTYTIQGDLTAHVVTNVGNTGYGPLDNSVGLIDASSTSHSYLWSDDPTVVITTGSGAGYAPVPEPTTLTYLILGAAALLGRRQRGRV